MSFSTGDVVKFISKTSDFPCKRYQIMIISEPLYMGKGEFEYATNFGSWFKESDFELIRKADKESFADLDKDLDEELC